MRCIKVMPDGQQTILLISNDAQLCAAACRDLQRRRPDVCVSAVASVEAAMRIVESADADVIVLAEGFPGSGNQALSLDTAVTALAVYAPVVVIGNAEHEPCLDALLAAGAADYVSRARGEGSLPAAIGLMERRLLRTKRIADSVPGGAEAWQKDFGEVLRHELNNPLTGILGNAELLLAEISRKNDGRLPHGGQQRVETIAALAVRLRETVRQLSHEWEARRDPVRSA